MKRLNPKRTKAGGKDFKPGQSGNPKGSSALARSLTVENKRIREADRNDLVKEVHFLLNVTESELREVVLNRDTEAKVIENGSSALRKSIAKAILVAIDLGDMRQLTLILEQAYGKVPAPVKLEGNLNHTHNLHAEIVKIINDIEGGLENGKKEDDEEGH